MDEIRLLTDVRALKGTLYFEFAPGPYGGKNWRSDSVFLSEDSFGLIARVFIRNIPGFSWYGPFEVRRQAWDRIVQDLYSLEVRARRASGEGDLSEDLSFSSDANRGAFQGDFQANALDLATMIRQLADWLISTLRHHECISILGI